MVAGSCVALLPAGFGVAGAVVGGAGVGSVNSKLGMVSSARAKASRAGAGVPLGWVGAGALVAGLLPGPPSTTGGKLALALAGGCVVAGISALKSARALSIASPASKSLSWYGAGVAGAGLSSLARLSPSS